jgi:hypothetical protein
MLDAMIAIVVLAALVVGPLLWRVRQDRRAERAQAIRARALSALFRALGGESLVAVEVKAASLWRAGRVVLSAPADWHRLLDSHWSAVVEQVPPDYELVVRPVVVPAPYAPLTEDVALRRAA